MTERYELSRRKTLAGLATIGAAGAGAGLGTSALFSDEESFEGNVVQAGTLDMTVTAEVVAHVDNDYWNNLELGASEADGEAGVAISVDDVKPGDWAIICFDVAIEENPGYVQTTTLNLENAENGLTEPEANVDSSGGDPGAGNGELQDELLAEIYQTFDENADANPPRSHLGPSGGDPAAPEGNTVQDTYDTFSGGVLMRDGNGDPLEVGAGQSETWYLLLYLPTTVGNVIQGDSLSFDLLFNTQQVRNNDDPFSTLTAQSEVVTQPGDADPGYPGSFSTTFDGSTVTVDLSQLPETFDSGTQANDHVGVFFGNGGTATSEVKRRGDGTVDYVDHNGGDGQSSGDFTASISGDTLTVTAPASTYDSFGVITTLNDSNQSTTQAVATATDEKPWVPGSLYQL